MQRMVRHLLNAVHNRNRGCPIHASRYVNDKLAASAESRVHEHRLQAARKEPSSQLDSRSMINADSQSWSSPRDAYELLHKASGSWHGSIRKLKWLNCDKSWHDGGATTICPSIHLSSRHANPAHSSAQQLFVNVQHGHTVGYRVVDRGLITAYGGRLQAVSQNTTWLHASSG